MRQPLAVFGKPCEKSRSLGQGVAYAVFVLYSYFYQTRGKTAEIYFLRVFS